MKYSFSNKSLKNNFLTYKFSLWDTWTHSLTNVYIKDKDGNKFDLFNLSIVKKYKIDDDFLINNIDKLDWIIFPFFKKENIWTKLDNKKNEELFVNYNRIFSKKINIQQDNTGATIFLIKIDINRIFENINKDDMNIIEKMLFLWLKKSKKNILDNMKFFANIVLYSWFLDVNYINNLKIFDNNKIEFMMSKKSWSKKNIFYSMNLEKILYYSFADYYSNYKSKTIHNKILLKFLQWIFEKIEKDVKNKNEYFELINKIKQKLSYNNNDFYKILEIILLISIL